MEKLITIYGMLVMLGTAYAGNEAIKPLQSIVMPPVVITTTSMGNEDEEITTETCDGMNREVNSLEECIQLVKNGEL